MQTASSEHIWQRPAGHPLLGSGEVHVWRAALDVPMAQLQQLQNLLSDDEIRRAERFFSADDRNHFIAARGLLRVILGRYLDRAPQQVRFA
jgi:4'-phosphopantetheinyl transferase